LVIALLPWEEFISIRYHAMSAENNSECFIMKKSKMHARDIRFFYRDAESGAT
jgi:hypothetical protein